MTGSRLTVSARLVLTLCTLAGFSIALALVLQDRSLSKDLERAARERLDRSASAAKRLLENHLSAIAERYRAVAGTPELRANLEVDHAPTLAYYANRLARQQDAALILFANRSGETMVRSGRRELASALRRHLSLEPDPRCDPAWHGPALAEPGCPFRGDHGEEASLFVHEGKTFTLAVVPLFTARRLVGRLVALEALPDGLLEGWSELCGARVSIEAAQEEVAGALEKRVRRLENLEVRVASSLRAERDALANSRKNLLAAGLMTLLLAFAASFVLARGLLRPMREIQRATERIGHGELSLRLRMDRSDEIGDVARALDLMLERLEKTQGRLANAQRLARLGNWAIDIETGELQGSSEFRRIYEIEPEAGPLSVSSLLSRIHPDDRDRFRTAVEEWSGHGKPFRIDHRLIQLDGSERILHSQGEATIAEHGTLLLEGTVQDITERKLVEDQIRYLAYHDSLTGLGNRRLFRECLSLAMEESRTAESMLGVLFLDVDNFKVINDTLGHSAGDQMLKSIADRLLKSVRSADTLSCIGSDLPPSVYRLGGDEFVLLLSRINDPMLTEKVAQRLLRSMSKPFELESREVVTTASIGITLWPADGDDVESLLRNSDTAMHHAKKLGRNNYQFYTEALQEAAFRRFVVESKVRRAIKREEFFLEYQPKVETDSGRVTGLEALVRWRDPELGIVLPEDFIPLAEETGLIVSIGEWVLRKAAEQAKVWEAEGLGRLQISVNLSAYEVEGTAIAKTVAEILDETNLDPSQLELEITESTLLQDEDKAIAWLHLLNDLGVKLSLDDFGTGYSSLSYLRRLPIDALKIDRSFVREIETDADDAALAGAIISMAKALRLRVVVEGVETEEQRELLGELGCDEIQGYLVSAPVPAEHVARTLSEIEAPKRAKRKGARGWRTQRRTRSQSRRRTVRRS